MTKTIILCAGLAAITLLAGLFVIKNNPPPSKEAVEQLQRLNENLEKLYYQRSPLDMRFPVRADQRFTA